MTSRAALHELVDSLPDGLLDDAATRLTTLQEDALTRALENAPEDDEPYTDEERRRHDEILARSHGEGPIRLTTDQLLQLVRSVQ